jgi:hypothetical protein
MVVWFRVSVDLASRIFLERCIHTTSVSLFYETWFEWVYCQTGAVLRIQYESFHDSRLDDTLLSDVQELSIFSKFFSWPWIHILSVQY